ncbi:MAG: hypothetical protein WBF77_13610 [Sulfurimonadaceae bacterium]
MMQTKSFIVTLAILLSLLIGGGNSALADENLTTEQTSQDAWQFNLAPFYLWGINLDGDMTAGTQIVPIDVPFSDIFDSLDGAFIVHFEGMHKNRWGFLVDLNYMDLASSFTGPLGLKRYDIDLDITLAELSGLYRMEHDAHNFDVIFGLRYVDMSNKLMVENGPTLIDGSKSWVDPLIGGRWIWGFSQNWALNTRGDIGGFSLGSDLSWQAAGLIEWQPFKYASFLAGYRAIGMDYDEGSGADYFKFDATIHGPLIGLNFKW